MYNFRFREEQFGFIVSLPNGDVKIINKNARGLLEQKRANLLKSYEIPLEKIALLRYLPFSAPICIGLELTLRCNLQCNHCYINAGKSRGRELTTQEIKDLLLRLKKMGVFFIFITGGEPLLREDFKEIIDYLFTIDLDFNVLTNGTLLTESFLKRLNPKTPFVVSFDGIKTHNIIRKGFEQYGSIQEKLLLLKKHKFPFLAQYTLQKCNFEDLIETYKWCVKNEIVLVAMDLLYAGRVKSNKQIIPTKEDLIKNKKLMLAKLDYEKKRMNFKNNSYDCQNDIANPYYYSFITKLVINTRKSQPGIFFAYISSDGNVYPDNYYAEDSSYIEGSIFERSFEDIWENGFQHLRKIGWDNFDCNRCKLLKKVGFCDLQMLNLSRNIHKDEMKCGATIFLKEAMLQRFLLRQKTTYALPEEMARFLDNY